MMVYIALGIEAMYYGEILSRVNKGIIILY